MLAIRMQRTGRKGHSQFRVVVQDRRFSPSSGRVVAHIGSYNPHTKDATLDKPKAQSYLDNGAQPSERVVKLLKEQGIKIPAWVVQLAPKERTTRNQDKLRRNRPAEPKAAEEVSPEPESALEADVDSTKDVVDSPEATVAENSNETTPKVSSIDETTEETPVVSDTAAQPDDKK